MLRLENIIATISERVDSESYTYRIAASKHVHKIYFNREEDELRRYAQTQNALLGEPCYIETTESITIGGEEVRGFTTFILELPEESYPATFIGKDRTERIAVRITSPRYIPGENMEDILRGMNQEDYNSLRYGFGSFLCEWILGLARPKGIMNPQINFTNMILERIQDSVGYIVLTDIAANMQDIKYRDDL